MKASGADGVIVTVFVAALYANVVVTGEPGVAVGASLKFRF